MLPAKRPSRSATRQKGAVALLLVGFVALAVGGLSVAMTLETRGAKTDVDRSDAQVRALELCETGIARAQMEICAMTDADGNGIGNVAGSYAGGTYSVTATQNGSDWQLVATGRVAKSTRKIEQGVHRTITFGRSYGLRATGDLTTTGSNTQTDSYDSRLGTYASQATNTDAKGPYAGTKGGIGTNGNVYITDGRIRGDAIPGVGGTTTISGGGVVTGSTAAPSTPLSLPNPPLTDFTAALAVNDNGNWSNSGATVTYNALGKTFSASGGGTVTFPGGTYIFSTFSLSGNTTVEFTGPTTIYVTNGFDTSGGVVNNTTGIASDLSVIAQQYALPGIPTIKKPTYSLSGGSGSFMTYYGPSTDLSISGGSSLYGSFVGKNVTLGGGTFVHYDQALDGGGTGIPHVSQTYWRESKPPLF